MKNIQNRKLWLVLAALIWVASACKVDDFGDMNVDPNNASKPNITSMLTGAMRTVRLGVSDGSATQILYAQHWSEITYTTISTYSGLPFDYAIFYTTMNNLQYIINYNTDPATKGLATAGGSNANQIALARILKAYYFSVVTDRWGDIPYSEALKGNNNFRPKFDKQQDIYNDLFKELKEAQAQFDSGNPVKGDFLFAGNNAKWKKFANSLRLVLALRLSKVDPAKGKTEFNAALADGVFTSNDDNLVYKYQQDSQNENPWYTSFVTSGRLDFAVSATMVNYMKPLNDPRLGAYADKTVNSLDYVGMPYGLKNPGIKPADVSLPTAKIIKKQDAPAYVLSYPQILFSKAEAAKLGWISDDAKSSYEAAIKASMDQWGVYTDAAFAAFIAQNDVKYNDANALELIGKQKWVALYMQGHEAWAEWRRTGYPALLPGPGAANPSKQIPRRLGYPVSERDLNSANYKAVQAVQGEDSFDTRVWWDKK
ncbi:Starch-binding associating with outer membrane [Pseudarcicella hirudinis]|uniref:Starch-binding associating with outer membrane n=1 Tax=Pseudarcicella hirudinis TaxID=1079859 RepID=A0A1I5P2D4_9BACT|nr:SusD/RagB family nutrient-binding outer membrane lipoprotein [Pseudarcicella hirudinis]SFP27701.1 Starch-binding associating with outer membrane [Pseudarcicella hirudinis]